ncbi:MAG: hypothetical protein ABI211_05670 [Vicinamibacterales bacterium]
MAVRPRADRARSHGCIRVQDPSRLAAALLAPQGWTDDGARRAMHGGWRQVGGLDRNVPVYIPYLTAMVHSDGQLRFAPDVYGHDARAIADLFGADENSGAERLF